MQPGYCFGLSGSVTWTVRKPGTVSGPWNNFKGGEQDESNNDKRTQKRKIKIGQGVSDYLVGAHFCIFQLFIFYMSRYANTCSSQYCDWSR